MLCHWVSSSGHWNFCQYFGNSFTEWDGIISQKAWEIHSNNLKCRMEQNLPRSWRLYIPPSATSQRQYTHWDTPLLRRATYGILCQVHIKHVVGMLTWRIWYVHYSWACWCSTLLYLSYQLKTSWCDFNRKEGTAEQGLFRYLLHERMTAFTHNASVNHCAMWNVEYHCESEVEATNISLSQIHPLNMMKSQQYNLKLLIRHQIITKQQSN